MIKRQTILRPVKTTAYVIKSSFEDGKIYKFVNPDGPGKGALWVPITPTRPYAKFFVTKFYRVRRRYWFTSLDTALAALEHERKIRIKKARNSKVAEYLQNLQFTVVEGDTENFIPIEKPVYSQQNTGYTNPQIELTHPRNTNEIQEI